MCTAPTATLWQPSWLLASQSSVTKAKEQSFSQRQAEARRDVQGAGSCTQSGAKLSWLRHQNNCKLKTWSPPDLTCSGSLERKARVCTSAEEQRQQGLHPLCAVCLRTMGHQVRSCGFPVRERRCPVFHARFQHQKRTEVKVAAGHLCPLCILALQARAKP